MKHRLIKIAFCLGLLCCLSSCTTKLAYNWLDWGLRWKIGGLIPLDEKQKQGLRIDVQAFHQWHRRTQLPKYAAYILEFRKRVQSKTPFEAKEIHAITDDVQLLLDVSLNHVMPDIEKLLVSLDDKQVAFLLKRLDEERQEYVDEYIEVTEKKRHEIRVKELTYYTRKLFGRLNATQMQWVQAWSEALVPYEALNAQQQILWQTAIADLLERRKTPEGIRSELSNLMFYRTDNWQAELREAMDHNQALTYELIAKLFNNLSEKQQTRFEDRLLSYAKDFEELSQAK